MSLSTIPNRINQFKHCCSHCGKGYKTRSYLEKHLSLCEFIHKKTTNVLWNEEEMPSQQKMYSILLELAQKYNKLEEKVDELNKWVVKKKKKINILEWLNVNITPSILFENLLDKIYITDEHIDHLFNNSFYDTLNEILEKYIYNINENETPLFVFIQNNNTFYIYDKIDEKYIWIELSKEKLIKFLNKIQMKISKKLYEWKKIHNEEIKENEKLSQIYDKATIKLMSMEFKQENTLCKIKSMMYSKMKTDIKAVVEYEFEF
jgi:hypothetical protein